MGSGGIYACGLLPDCLHSHSLVHSRKFLHKYGIFDKIGTCYFGNASCHFVTRLHIHPTLPATPSVAVPDSTLGNYAK